MWECVSVGDAGGSCAIGFLAAVAISIREDDDRVLRRSLAASLAIEEEARLEYDLAGERSEELTSVTKGRG